MNEPLAKQRAQWPSLKQIWCGTGPESAAVPTRQPVSLSVCPLIPHGKMQNVKRKKKLTGVQLLAKFLPQVWSVSVSVPQYDLTLLTRFSRKLLIMQYIQTALQVQICHSVPDLGQNCARSVSALAAIRLFPSHHQSLSLVRLQLARSPPRASRPMQLRVAALIDSRCIMMDVLHSSKRDGCLGGNSTSGLMQRKPPNSLSVKKTPPKNCRGSEALSGLN